MASVTITIPDSLVPEVLAAFRFRWPQLIDLTNVEAGKQGVILAVREAYRSSAVALAQQNQTNTLTTNSSTIV